MIEEVIYLPALRCNLNCEHCGENQNVPAKEEIDCAIVIEQIVKSELITVERVSISGGEPFLNDTLAEAIKKGIETSDIVFDITSNGYFVDCIQKLVNNVGDVAKERLHFNISIDGLENTHNAIRRNTKSYQNAVETVRFLAENHVPVSVNTVVQDKNLTELAELHKKIIEISPDIRHTFIPLSIDISEKKENVYTEQYKRIAWKYVETDKDKKIIGSDGMYRVTHCHAGQKNIVIGPDGKVYACLTGAYYKTDYSSRKFMLGDIKKYNLDKILQDKIARYRINKSVKKCARCSNPCETNREVNLFGQDIRLQFYEAKQLLSVLKEEKGVIFDTGSWYVEESIGERWWRWSRKNTARIFVLNDGKNNYLSFSVNKGIETNDYVVSINDQVVDGNENFYDIDLSVYQEDLLVVEIVSEVWTPADHNMGDDTRVLGIAVENISVRK